MKLLRIILLALLVLLYLGMGVTISEQCAQLNARRIPEERLIALLEQTRLNERRLTVLAAQNETLTSRTLAIWDRLVPPGPQPCHEPDQPLIIYEAVPVKLPAKKGRRE